MDDNSLLNISVCVAPGIVAFVEIFRAVSFSDHVLNMLRATQKSAAVIRSSKISDHWKERALPMYSRRIMRSSLAVAAFLGIGGIGFAAVYYLLGLLVIKDTSEIMSALSRPDVLALSLILGLFYAYLRSKTDSKKQDIDSDYTASSKILHHFALGNPIVRQMAFDIDCMMSKNLPIYPSLSTPVYVAGLARAGTTILLEALYATGQFTTLTYRDMPLVTAPYFWNRITARYKRGDNTKRERAHGDKLQVNFDSPEAFEEVFWMTFAGPSYVREDRLEPQSVDPELVEKYRKYVRNILSKPTDTTAPRYLAKNNNNLLRLDMLRSAFEDATIIIPFRNPIAHASSLLAQHHRFLDRHSYDPFSEKYMHWLGHFEFGSNMRPFYFHSDTLPLDKNEPATLDYWLRYWACVYGQLIQRYDFTSEMFFDYDKFCRQPDVQLKKLEAQLSLPEHSLTRFSTKVRTPGRYPDEMEENRLPDGIREVYTRLQEICL